MVEASEVKAEPEIFSERGSPRRRGLIVSAVATDKAEPTSRPDTVVLMGTPIHRMRKGVKVHVPSDYYALLYNEEAKGVCRIRGVFEYSEPEAPHKIDELPEVPLKGIIRKSFEVKSLYIKNDREDFEISLPDHIYSTKKVGLSAVLTTDLMPVHYNIFRLEVVTQDPSSFLTQLISERIDPSYRKIKDRVLQELYWIIHEELTKYDLLNAIKKKDDIQKTVSERFSGRLNEISLELLSFVWDYDLDEGIRDRYFWLHVQNISPSEVLRMETLLNMSRELSKSPYTTGPGSQTVLQEPLRRDRESQ